MKLFPLLLMLLLIAGCGGGASESPAPTVATTPEPVTTTETQKMADLKTSKQFIFNSNVSLTLVLPANTDTSQKYFVNVCTNFTENTATIDDYSSCKVRGLLNDVQQIYTINLSSSEQRLMAQIWPMKQDAEVITQYFTVSADQQTWELTL